MGIYGIVKARLEVLDAQSQNLDSKSPTKSSKDEARGIVRETMKLYKQCKDTELRCMGKCGAAGFTTGFTAVATLGFSVPVGMGVVAYNIEIGEKWEALKEISKKVGRRAANHAGTVFKKESSGFWAFAKGTGIDLDLLGDDFDE